MTRPDRVLVFSPHPDDVELFMGGTLLKHVAEGSAVRVVMMTRGEKGSLLSLLGKTRQEALKRVRDAELKERYLRLPTVELWHFDLPDRGVRETPSTVARTLACVREFAPDVIYLPESEASASLYTHRDHLATGRIVEAARGQHSPPPRLRYFHSKAPDVFVDVSDFQAENLNALRCYRSQYRATAGPPFLLHLLERELVRRTQDYGSQAATRFAEGFREVAGNE
jgi:N-acetylglucosamine malate deacetylase 1